MVYHREVGIGIRKKVCLWHAETLHDCFTHFEVTAQILQHRLVDLEKKDDEVEEREEEVSNFSHVSTVA